MRVRTLLLLGLATLLVAVPTALAGSSHRSSNSTNFPDSTGENPPAPDITSVDVSNDDAGLITFQVNISNRPAFTDDMLLLLFMDTDQNASTGDPDPSTPGADYAIQMVPGAADLFQWQASANNYLRAPSQASLTFSYTASGATIRISAADLGKTKVVKFSVLVISGITVSATGDPDFTNAHADAAPDPGHGFNTYQVLTKIVLSATAFTTAPKPAKAGRAFSVSMAVTENDTQGPITSGTVLCAASLAGKRIVATRHVVANGIATCVFKIPLTAKGRIIRGTIAVIVQGAQVSRPFSARIT
jgi:hypothetical protein